MKKIAIVRQQSESAYLNTAPEALIRLHRQIGPGKEILGRLLTDTKMDKAWTILSSHVKVQIYPQPGNPILKTARMILTADFGIRSSPYFAIVAGR